MAEGLGRTFLAFRKYLRHKKESEGGSLVVGKEPLPFAAYMIFGEYFYSAAEGGAFAAAFQTLMWSLMARSVNIGLIKLDHVSQVGEKCENGDFAFCIKLLYGLWLPAAVLL